MLVIIQPFNEILNDFYEQIDSFKAFVHTVEDRSFIKFIHYWFAVSCEKLLD